MKQEISDEIDILELVSVLWEGKWKIATSMAVFAALAAAYAFTRVPYYESQAIVMMPLPGDIASINIGRNSVEPLKPYSVKDVYDQFSMKLNSEVAKREFFEKVYWPSLSARGEGGNKANTYNQFLRESLTVAPVDKSFPDLLLVKVSTPVQEKAASFIDGYIKLVASQTIDEIVTSVESETAIAKQNIVDSIVSERAAAEKSREDMIVKLGEALAIAKAISLENPRMTVARPSAKDLATPYIDGSQLYMAGSLALQQEIAVLESRKSNDAFIPTLRALESRVMRLEKISIDKRKVQVFRYYEMAETPLNPSKPKKMLTVVVGFMSGGVFAALALLIKKFVR